MANDKSYKKLTKPNQDIESDHERIWLLMDWAELIHKDLGAFIGALDRFYLEKQAAEQPPTKDFLFAANSNKD
jgi:hypothetical protein